jgi:hypothetical protein
MCSPNPRRYVSIDHALNAGHVGGARIVVTLSPDDRR